MDPKRISKSEFEARALELMREVEQTGEPLVVTHSGKAVLQVLPHSDDPRRALERFRQRPIRFDDPLAPVGEDEWEVS